MNSPAVIYALRWLIRDTFRQALASRVFWIMLGVTGLCVVFCLGISIESAGGLRSEKHTQELFHPKTGEPLVGITPDLGRMNLLFGAFRVQLHREGESEVRFIQVFLASWVAGAAGLLLTLVWTAGFLPEFLQPSSASVLLAKPAPRWLILVGKYLGVVLFVAFQAGIFFLGTWLALGARTGYWLPGYLAGFPLLVLHFAVIYSFSVLLAVATRSTISCVLGVLLFWAVCFGVNYARHSSIALPRLARGAQPLPTTTAAIIELGYWLTPKPADILLILEDALDAGSEKATLSSLPEFAAVRDLGRFDPIASLFASLLFAPVMLWLSAHQLSRTDY